MTSFEAPLPKITVHGRWQPPFHQRHWDDLVWQGFERAEHVTLLVTNPDITETYDSTAPWRSAPKNNPFTFDEREFMIRAFLERKGIDESRFAIRKFNIKEPLSFKTLDPAVPNLICVYSPWSAEKAILFQKHSLPIIRLERPKAAGEVSGTKVRGIINAHTGSDKDLETKLVAAGFMPEAVPGLLTVLHEKRKLKPI